MTDKSKILNFNRLLLAGIVVASAVVFIIDLQTPLGLTGDVAYVLFVMATYWMKGKKDTIVAGALTTLLLIVGFVFSAPSQYIAWASANRILTLVAIWASVWFVSHYKASLDQLRENERRYRTLFQATNDETLVFQLDNNDRPRPFLEVNNAACHMLGHTREELLQKTLYDIAATGPEEIDRRIREAIRRGETVFETRHRTREGEMIPLELSVRSFIYNGSRTLVFVGRDLRERLKLEQEILNVSEQERRRIGQDMHDDLGQLLSVATLTAQMLGHEMKTKGMQEAQKVLKLSDMIKTAGERTRTLSHGLVPVNIESSGLNGALQGLTDSVSSMYDINIFYTGDEDIILDDHYSAVHLYRIAQEAISNAVKHGGAMIIEVELYASGDHIFLRVKDNGNGFPESKAMNEGIGLRTMNFRANMIRGDLKINSERGKGTEIICQVAKTNL